jgi:hypothetical protein
MTRNEKNMFKSIITDEKQNKHLFHNPPAPTAKRDYEQLALEL